MGLTFHHQITCLSEAGGCRFSRATLAATLLVVCNTAVNAAEVDRTLPVDLALVLAVDVSNSIDGWSSVSSERVMLTRFAIQGYSGPSGQARLADRGGLF